MRVLNRPMFRKGGSTAQGSGITSLQPRENFQLGTTIEKIRDLQSQYEQSIRKAAEPTAAEKAILIAQIASTPGNLYEKMKASLPATAKLISQKKAVEPQLQQARLKGELDIAKLEATATPKASTTQKDYQFLFSKYKQFRDAGIPAFKNKTDAELSTAALQAASGEFRTKTSPQDALRQLNLRFGEAVGELKAKLNQTQGTDQQSYENYKQQLENIYQAYGDAGIDITTPRFQIAPFVKRKKKSEGGRIGYADGTPEEEIVGSEIEQVAESTNPVQAGTQLKSFSYDELRGRLPQEVSNDIVKLLATSQQALEDFAYITTQSDIGNFNQKYGVNLTLPVSE